jgi:perosamine synthetase
MTLLADETRHAPFLCKGSESLLAAIEKCLDNGTGVCFVIDSDRRMLGRITLDDLRRAISDGGALVDSTLERHLADRDGEGKYDFHRGRNDTSPHSEVVMPVIDYEGRVIDVLVDNSKQFVQVSRPDLSHREFRALLDAFLSSWISSRGESIRQFEGEFASFIGMRHGIAVSNGTVALHLALAALGVGPGDEVIVPDLTFAATINAVLYCGATPVIVDVDPATWTMSAAGVRNAVTPRTRAIVPVHLYGRPAEMGPIAAFARERRLRVIEDCAEAHGARYAGRRLGSFSDVACFSFYGNKIVTTGEGGMCLTNSEALFGTLMQLRDHGMSATRAYWHDRVGYNYRMTNLQAAIGIAQLSRVKATLERNRRLEALYREHLAGIPGVVFPPSMDGACEPVVWLVCVQVPAEARDAVLDAAKRASVELRPFFHPLSTMPPYERYARACPHSQALSRTGINLPTSNAVDRRVAEKVAAIFRGALA